MTIGFSPAVSNKQTNTRISQSLISAIVKYAWSNSKEGLSFSKLSGNYFAIVHTPSTCENCDSKNIKILHNRGEYFLSFLN